MLDTVGINITQLVGVLAFAAASVACFVSGRSAELQDARIWKLLAVLNSLFLVDICLGFRYRFHDFIVAIMIEEQRYSQRNSAQAIIILFSSLIVLTLAGTIFVQLRPIRCSAIVAMSLTTGVALLFTLETISLHAVDAVLYRPIASVLIVGWIWATASLGVVLAATFRVAASYRKPPHLASS
jgi:hypothetical protein